MTGTVGRALRRALTLVAGAPSALIVPVEPLPLPPAGRSGLPHHVTVLYPFVRPRLLTKRIDSRLRSAFGAVPRFDLRLTEVRRFPDVVYLVPDPAEPFVELTHACVAAVPSHQPYRGVFAEVVPHVTVLEREPEPDGLEAQLSALLPLSASAEAVELFVRDRAGTWRRHRRYPLGEVGGR
ncbi:MAG: 2'-5' RNA ligase family protein [Curtobacterium sp.]